MQSTSTPARADSTFRFTAFGTIALFACALSANLAFGAVVTTNTWNVATGGTWNDPNNWSAVAVPVSTDHAALGTILPVGVSTITLDATQTVHSFDGSPGAGGKTVNIDAGTGGT